MPFTAKDVADLREKTGCGMMECKKALSETDGDMAKAIDFLRERGLAAAEKKAGRIAAEGIVYAVKDGAQGAIVEVNSETDFVAKNESFRAFVDQVARTIIKENPADVAALLACPTGSGTVEDELREKILTIGENIKIRRFFRYEGALAAYNHGGGTHAVLVQFQADLALAAKPEFEALAKDVAMQIAAANPSYVSREEVPAEALEKERQILTQQAINEGKPANIAEKMVAGRIQKYYLDVCLLDQPFIKDNEINVAQYVANTAKELGGDIKILAFTRYEKGEGLEKRQDDFAAEVASLQNK